MKLLHITSNVEFTYIGEFKPQFTNQVFVSLRNEKTGKTENFNKGTYLNYFKTI